MSVRPKTKARSRGSRRLPGIACANWLYTQPEVHALFHVCPCTIGNWRRNGLRPCKTNVRLFLWRVLNAFHKRRCEDARRPFWPRRSLLCLLQADTPAA